MKLLMITRKVDRNEHLAGFIYDWVKKIASHIDELRVIAWQEGDASGLPANVTVIELRTKQNKLLKIGRLKWLVWKNLKNVDGVFCHQMPVYTIIAAPLAKLRGKKVISWYVHKQVDFKMKLMEKFADAVLTASKESFRLPSKKVIVVGHGIDTEMFRPGDKKPDGWFKILSVGRISPTKDYESMVKALDILQDQGIKNVSLTIIGTAGLASQQAYFENLKKMVEAMKLTAVVKFIGSRPHHEIPDYLRQADLFINLSGTGSLDKAVLEAMACGCLVLTSNEAFDEILTSELKTKQNQPAVLAQQIKTLIAMPITKKQQWRHNLRIVVVRDHNLDILVKKIVNLFKK